MQEQTPLSTRREEPQQSRGTVCFFEIALFADGLLGAGHGLRWLALLPQLQSGPLYGGSVVYLTRTFGSFPVFFQQCFSEHPCTCIFVFLCKPYSRKWHCGLVAWFENICGDVSCSPERGNWVMLPSGA